MPSTIQHLANAPIVEAMIAFDFSTLADLTALRDRFYETIQADYPNHQGLQIAKVSFDPDGGSSSGNTETVGARFVSADGKRVCLINNNSFICSRLHPYETWESLRDEFARLWKHYSSLAKMEVRKVAVRYINKLFIPEGVGLAKFVNTFPQVADGLPKEMFNIWVRIEMMIPDPPGTLIVTEAQLPPELPGRVGIILDHDLQFPINDPTTDIWDVLKQARKLKNQYFFASISDDLMKEYQ